MWKKTLTFMTATSETDLKRQLAWHGDYEIDLDIYKKTYTYTKRPTHIKKIYDYVGYVSYRFETAICLSRRLQISPTFIKRDIQISKNCNALQHAATRCNSMQHNGTHYKNISKRHTNVKKLQRTATRCNTLQLSATQCTQSNTLQAHIKRTYTCEMRPTGWRRLIGSPNLQIIFHKRATKYKSFLRKMTYEDKGSKVL